MNNVRTRRLLVSLCATLSVLAMLGCPSSGGDATPPTVSEVNPADAAVNVNVTGSIVAIFDEEMDGVTIDAASFTLESAGGPVAGIVSYADKMATFNPDANLGYQTEYTATLAGGVKDVSGNALGADYVWAFTTSAPPDTTAPTIVSTVPGNAAIGVAISGNIYITFNEAMDSAKIIPANITLSAGAVPVAGTVTYDIPNNKAIFAPTANLEYNTEYTGTVLVAVTDVAGNALAAEKVWTFTTTDLAGAGPAPVRLGTAGNFVILAKTAITDVPPCAITGDVGLSPAAESYITGFSQTKATGYSMSPQVTGFIYAADMTPPTPSNMTTAVSDMETAYTDAAGRPSVPANLNLGGGTIGGLTFVPGVYTWGSTVQMDADITLAGGGGSNDVWIFQISEDLVVASGMQVILSGGAQARNVFWQVAGIATLGTGSSFKGVILSQTQIQLATGASLNGRALAQTQVTLDQNAVTAPAQ